MGRSAPAVVAGTRRPRNRKAQIIAAAADLFYRFGYHNVGTEDIAEAVGITAGALYRHFRSKRELLARTLIESFDRADAVMREGKAADLTALVRALAEIAAARRDLGVLWNREARHLDDTLRRQTRRRFREFLVFFAGALRTERPDLADADAELLAWASVSVLTSASYHRTVIRPEILVELLRRMTMTVCRAELPARPAGAASPAAESEGVSLGSRREELLAAATHLFSTRGYQTVTMDDVGRAVGVTSTSVYRYFATKGELLTAVVSRGNEPLQLGLSRALATARTPERALENAARAYLEFATDHHDLLGVLIAEVMNLPQPHRGTLPRAQHDYVAEWLRLLATTRPELSGVEVRCRVHAALTVVNNVARNGRLRAVPGTRDVLLPLVLDVLGG